MILLIFTEVKLEECDLYVKEDKDPLSENNPADFSHSKDTLVSSITIVEHNIETLEDNVKVEDDEIKVEYIDSTDEFLNDPLVAEDDSDVPNIRNV